LLTSNNRAPVPCASRGTTCYKPQVGITSLLLPRRALLLLLLHEHFLVAQLYPPDQCHDVQSFIAAITAAAAAAATPDPGTGMCLPTLLPATAAVAAAAAALKLFLDTLPYQLHELLQPQVTPNSSCLLPLQRQLYEAPVQLLLPLLCCCHPGRSLCWSHLSKR
jgi:hypothetical protein